MQNEEKVDRPEVRSTLYLKNRVCNAAWVIGRLGCQGRCFGLQFLNSHKQYLWQLTESLARHVLLCSGRSLAFQA